MLALTSTAVAGFVGAPLAPAARPAPAVRMMSVESMIGKYSVKQTVFDPLGFSEK
jgi:hypothetical protein